MKRARQAKTLMVVNYSNCRDIYQHANIQMDFLHKRAFLFICISFVSYDSSLYLYILKVAEQIFRRNCAQSKITPNRTLVNIVWAHWTDYYSRQPSYYRLSGKHKVGFNHNHTPTLSQITELGLDGVFSGFTKNTCIMYAKIRARQESSLHGFFLTTWKQYSFHCKVMVAPDTMSLSLFLTKPQNHDYFNGLRWQVQHRTRNE